MYTDVAPEQPAEQTIKESVVANAGNIESVKPLYTDVAPEQSVQQSVNNSFNQPQDLFYQYVLNSLKPAASDIRPRSNAIYQPIPTDIPNPQSGFNSVIRTLEMCLTDENIKFIRKKLEAFSASDAYTIDIPEKKMKNALRYLAPGLPSSMVIGFVDTTILCSCKEGILISPDYLFIRKGEDSFSVNFKLIRNIFKVNTDSGSVIYVRMLNGIYFPFSRDNFCILNDSKNVDILYELLIYILMLVDNFRLRPNIRISNNFESNIDSIVSKYRIGLATRGSKVYFRDNMPLNQLNQSIKQFAKNILPWQCLLYSDTTYTGNAKNGIIVTIWGIYSNSGNKQTALYFSDIDSLSLCSDSIDIKLINGSRFSISVKAVDAGKLKELIDEIMAFYASYLGHPERYDHNENIDYFGLLRYAYEDLSQYNQSFLIEQSRLCNPKAAVQLALRARFGFGVPYNINYALDLLSRVQSAEAYRIMGEIYYNGEGVQKNTTEAENYFKISAGLGDLLAQTALGNILFLGINREKANHKKAYEIYKRIYDTVEYDKIPVSLKVNLGVCYLYGYGCNKDTKKAEELFLTVKDNDFQAKYLLSMLYIEDEDFRENIDIGIKWLHELADAGYESAFVNLGILYFKGEHIESDPGKAIYYLEKVRQFDSNQPNYAPGCYYYSLICFYYYNDITTAAFYMKEAADRGMVEALRDFAVMNQFGLGVKKDIYAANDYYSKAAVGGDDYSSHWRDYTKKYLNSLRVLSKIHTDDEDKYDFFFSKTDETINDSVNGYGLNSYVYNYPQTQSTNIPERSFEKLKRKYADIERNLSFSAQVSLAQLNVGKIFVNFSKFSQRQAHGQGHEYATHVDDLLHFRFSSWIAGDNVKGGADRVVGMINKKNIQCKCSDDVDRLMRMTFDKYGNPKYVTENGEPMIIQTNSDSYDGYRNRVAELKGEEFADKYTMGSGYTKEQSENIAKFGNIDSLKVDMKLGAVTALYGTLISSAITYTVSRINGADNEEALKAVVKAGIVTFGTTFATTVLTAQATKLLTQTGHINDLFKLKAFDKMAKSKSVQKVISKGNSSIATTTGAKNYIKSTVISNVATIAVLSSADIARIITGRISKEQLFKNVAVTSASVVGGSAGFAIGSACGSIVPGVGTVIGGFIGSCIASSIASKAVKCTLDVFIENDGDKMLEIINNELGILAEKYLLSEDELNLVIDDLRGSDLLTDSGLRDIYQAENRPEFCRTEIIPIVEEICSIRNYTVLPSDEDIMEGFVQLSNEYEYYDGNDSADFVDMAAPVNS